MKRKIISQREARKLRKRIDELETQERNRRNRWWGEWGPSWVNIATITLTAESFARIETARKLHHAVVVVPESAGTNIRLYADAL